MPSPLLLDCSISSPSLSPEIPALDIPVRAFRDVWGYDWPEGYRILSQLVRSPANFSLMVTSDPAENTARVILPYGDDLSEIPDSKRATFSLCCQMILEAKITLLRPTLLNFLFKAMDANLIHNMQTVLVEHEHACTAERNNSLVDISEKIFGLLGQSIKTTICYVADQQHFI